jgi:ubiquinone/menaquinone biosynthesis C-methylase UbiE
MSVADRVEVETGDITRLPFSDASFDAVISMTVILLTLSSISLWLTRTIPPDAA